MLKLSVSYVLREQGDRANHNCTGEAGVGVISEQDMNEAGFHSLSKGW